MSDERAPDQTIPQHRTPPEGYATWNEYWTKVYNQPWRTEHEIDEERQRILAARRDTKTDIERGIYPFRDMKLERGDVEWLLATHESGGMHGPVNWSDVQQREREGLDLRGADLSHEDLRSLPMARTIGGTLPKDWYNTTEQQRDWARARFESTDLSDTHLEGTCLRKARLLDANLRNAHLEEADIHRTRLQRCFLAGATLTGTNLRWAHLEGAWMDGVNFGGANLSGAFFDEVSDLGDALLGDNHRGFALVADVRWDGLNLTTLQWDHVKVLGDEWVARHRRTADGKRKSSRLRLQEYISAARANRQLAVVLRSQGMNEYSDRFAYRAQLCQRVVLRRQRHYLRYFGSFFLWLIAGYGYRPLRSFITYLCVVGVFAVIYFLLGNNIHPPLDPLGAVVFSITSFHGRGFTPGENVAITNPVTVLAAVEAIIGLLIEITFIATFTQRFFAR